MDFLIFWIGLSIAVACIAGGRGRSSFGWLLLSLIFSPLLAGLLLVILPNRKKPVVLQGLVQGTVREVIGPSDGKTLTLRVAGSEDSVTVCADPYYSKPSTYSRHWPSMCPHCHRRL